MNVEIVFDWVDETGKQREWSRHLTDPEVNTIRQIYAKELKNRVPLAQGELSYDEGVTEFVHERWYEQCEKIVKLIDKRLHGKTLFHDPSEIICPHPPKVAALIKHERQFTYEEWQTAMRTLTPEERNDVTTELQGISAHVSRVQMA